MAEISEEGLYKLQKFNIKYTILIQLIMWKCFENRVISLYYTVTPSRKINGKGCSNG